MAFSYETLNFFISSWEKTIFYNFVNSNFINYNPDTDTKKWISSKDTEFFGKLISAEIQKYKEQFIGTYLYFLVDGLNENSVSETFETICQLLYLQLKLKINILSPLANSDTNLNNENFVHPNKLTKNLKNEMIVEKKYLYNHQKNMILYLLNEEVKKKDEKIKCLTDETGSGKSNIILSLSFHSVLKENLEESVEVKDKKYDLIIVPHHLLRQWDDRIKEYDEKLGICISKHPQYTNLMDAIENNLDGYNVTSTKRVSLINLKVICITNNLYEKLNGKYINKHFERIFVDEDTKFNIKNSYDFLYYISATDDIPICYPEYFTEKSHVDIKLKYDIKIKDTLLKLNLLKLPYNFDKYFYDLTNDSINITNETIMNNFLMKFLSLDRDLQKEYNFLKKEIDLSNIRLNGYNEIIEKEKLKASEGKNTLEYLSVLNNLKDYNMKLPNVERKIEENFKTIEHIKNKILAKRCEICFINLKCDDQGNECKIDYVVKELCHNAICISCYEKLSKNKSCSFCRQENCSFIPFLNKIIRSKHDTILHTINQIIKQNNEARILIYAENVDNYNIIKQTYDKNCIIPKGNSDVIYKLINDYKFLNNDINHVKNRKNFYLSKKLKEIKKTEIGYSGFKILLINMDKMCAGFDLSMTTHLLLLSDPKDKRVEQQIIGRCYRNGRTSDLYINRILYENETDVKSMKPGEYYKYNESFKSTDLEPIGRFFNLGDFVYKTSGLKFRHYLFDQVLLNKTSYRSKIKELRFHPYN